MVTTATGVTTTEYVPDAAFNRASRTVTTASGSVTTTYAYDPGNRLSSVDSQPVDWNDFGETVTDHRGWDIDRAADGAEVALVDAAGIPAYGFTRGPGGEAIEVEESASGDTRSFLWGPSEADFPVSILDETGTDHLYVAAEGMVLGRVEGGALVPMAQDGLGSVVLDGVDLLPEPGAFGETPAPASAERRVYALLESLPGTSYHLPRRRLYDSDTGRFASADPIGLLGGDNRFGLDPPQWTLTRKVTAHPAPDPSLYPGPSYSIPNCRNLAASSGKSDRATTHSSAPRLRRSKGPAIRSRRRALETA